MRYPLSLLLLLISWTACSAGVMQTDWKSTGDGKLTRDTDQGLDFLDLTETQGRTFDEVSAQLGPGGGFNGFRFATAAEVIELVNNYGFNPSALDGTISLAASSDPNQLQGLIGLLGQTRGSSTLHQSRGFISDFVLPNSGSGSRRRIDIVHRSAHPDYVWAFHSFGLGTNQRDAGGGSFLVRPSSSIVPEPLSLSIWCVLGLTCLTCRHRRGR